MSEKRKAVWRSRRGLLELDVLLQPFAENCYDGLSCVQKRLLHEFLSLEDIELRRMIRSPDSAGTYTELVEAILDYRLKSQNHG
ncbi:MAG: succinate dehydrogenase assembly factor 2 [Gammaproteobacteria bacterium]|nr:succinate dehydrogenase assembly factor 2 [Gammaproteobacteria bacterium]